MTTDPRIDAYIENAAPFAQPILRHARALAHRALPGAVEGIKWGMPHLIVGGKNVVGLAAFKAHAAVVIHGEDRSREGMGSLGKLTSLNDLPPDEELIARIQAGLASSMAARSKRDPKPDLPVPTDLAAALTDAPRAREVFAGFAPSNQREYIEWITEAKREVTRTKRIVEAIEWLSEGRKRHWKYDDC